MKSKGDKRVTIHVNFPWIDNISKAGALCLTASVHDALKRSSAVLLFESFKALIVRMIVASEHSETRRIFFSLCLNRISVIVTLLPLTADC